MRFLHTADWHLGLRAAHLGGAGEKVREERFSTARKILEIARDESVEFILLAGDLFDDNAVDRVLIQRTADLLGKAFCPVFIIPGNHDPDVPGSVWAHPSFSRYPNIRVMRQSCPAEVPGGILFPCPLKEKKSANDPTAWIPPSGDRRIRIGMAHGSVEGCPMDDRDHPVPRDAAFRKGLDYLAMGHWHSRGLFADREGAVRMAYSGCHETTKFGEENSGNVLIVSIRGAREIPEVKDVAVGKLRWKILEGDIREEADLHGLVSQIEKMEEPERTLLEVRLRGYLPGSRISAIDAMAAILESRFFWWRLDEGTLSLRPSDSAWIAELGSGLLRETAERLSGCGAPEDIRRRALLELHSLAGKD